MSLYQCFFFTNGYIGNFENIECDTTASLRRLFGEMLSEGAWEAVEGWKNGMPGRTVRRGTHRVQLRLPGSQPGGSTFGNTAAPR